MKALITGASSGIGKEIALYLSSLGHDLILVSKTKDKLEEVANKIKTNVRLIILDLNDEKAVKELCLIMKTENIDILINNAGFGLFGESTQTDLNVELEMMNVNIKAVQILSKMFVKANFNKKSYLLNVSSSAGLMPGGPLMATYYATKSYITSYTLALYEELRRKGSQVNISLLCPGPVKTNFNNIAGVKFSLKSLTPQCVAKYAINKMFQEKLIIIPGNKIKIGLLFSRFLSKKQMLKIAYGIQKKKGN